MVAIENFVEQIVSTGLEIIDKPGFIICKVTNSNKPLSLRELILPEDVFIILEKKVKEKYGEKGLMSLYVAGKNFGYNYSKISDFVKYKKSSEKEFIEFMEFFMNYMKSWWASDYKYKFDFEKNCVDVEFSDYLICRKSGIGKIIKEGCMAGFFAYLLNDKTIEAKQLSCQGRGARICKTIYASAKTLNASFVEVKEQNYDDLTYNQINSIKPIHYSKNSLKDLMYSDFVKYEQGILNFGEFRHFLIGSNFLYDIEEEMGKLDGGIILFNSAKEVGKKIGANNNDLSMNLELLSGFGWGDFFVIPENKKLIVTIIHYPWFERINNHDCTFISGLLSGLFSTINHKDINFKVSKKDLSDKLDVVLEGNL